MACQRCNGGESVARYRVVKPGLTHERDLCAACAELTAAVYGLEPVDEAATEALTESHEEEAAVLEVDPESEIPSTIEETEGDPGEAPAAPEAAEEEPKPARKPRRSRSKS